MARRQTYGENMAAWERQNDEQYWEQSIYTALNSKNYVWLEELISEGVCEGYTFPNITDEKAIKMIEKYRHP